MYILIPVYVVLIPVSVFEITICVVLPDCATPAAVLYPAPPKSLAGSVSLTSITPPSTTTGVFIACP